MEPRKVETWKERVQRWIEAGYIAGVRLPHGVSPEEEERLLKEMFSTPPPDEEESDDSLIPEQEDQYRRDTT